MSDFKPSPKQIEKINSMQEGNPSMMPITWGCFSDGSISITIRWSFDQNNKYFLTIDREGLELSGSGPFAN